MHSQNINRTLLRRGLLAASLIGALVLPTAVFNISNASAEPTRTVAKASKATKAAVKPTKVKPATAKRAATVKTKRAALAKKSATVRATRATRMKSIAAKRVAVAKKATSIRANAAKKSAATKKSATKKSGMKKSAMVKKAALTDTTAPAFIPASTPVDGAPATVGSASPVKEAKKGVANPAKKSPTSRKSTRGKRSMKRVRAGL